MVLKREDESHGEGKDSTVWIRGLPSYGQSAELRQCSEIQWRMALEY